MLDIDKLRELAAEFGYYPATTNPEDIARHRAHNAAYEDAKSLESMKANYAGYQDNL
jgi:hypothetical protein